MQFKLITVVTVLFLFTLDFSESLTCWYGSEYNMFNLTSKKDDFCLFKLMPTGMKLEAMFLGQKGKPPRQVVFHHNEPACVVMPDQRGVYTTACYCRHSYCNDLDLVNQVRGTTS